VEQAAGWQLQSFFSHGIEIPAAMEARGERFLSDCEGREPDK
jgi:hypothetical protein